MQDGMYEISEMATMFDLSRQTLIYYDRIGLFHPAYVNDKGYRLYIPTQIPTLRLICMLRELGLELKEIERVLADNDAAHIVSLLGNRLSDIDKEVHGLVRQYDSVNDRLGFYREVKFWKEHLDRPILRQYPERHVVFEPFPAGKMDRSKLHPTLMRAIAKMKGVTGTGPLAGWGTMLLLDALRGEDPIAGAGSFVVAPDGEDVSALDAAKTLPEGIYLCFARWGMPYDSAGARRLVAILDEHRLHPTGNAFDYCFLDSTSYDDHHTEDFCCLQVPVEL